MIKAYAIGGLVIATVIGGGLWLRERDNRIKNAAIASERIRKDSITLITLNDSLKKIRPRLDTAIATVTKTITLYDTLRTRIRITDTSKFILVDTQFVHIADSVVRACSILAKDCATFKLFADSTIKTQDSIIVNLKKAARTSGKLRQIINYSVVGILMGTAGYLAGK